MESPALKLFQCSLLNTLLVVRKINYCIICTQYQPFLAMDTQNILRRIIDLKKISVELKQTVQDSQLPNTDLLQSILQLGKQKSHSKATNSFRQSIYQNQLTPQPLGQNGPVYNGASKLRESTTKGQDQNEGDHSFNGAESRVTGRTSQEPQTIPQQISFLKQQNSRIEQDIKNLQQKLLKLEEIQKQEQEQGWKDGLPYFEINIPKVRIFYTKLLIAEKDYDKIDYSFYSANLNLQKITLTQLPQTTSSSRPPKHIDLLLQDLKEVNYDSKKNIKKNGTMGSITQKAKEIEDEHIVIYQFKMPKSGQQKTKSKNINKSAFSRLKSESKGREDEENSEMIQTLFIKFQNQQQMKQWDLGLFINYKIIEDLNKGEFKMESYNSMNSSTITYEDYNRKEGEKANFQFKQLAQNLNLLRFRQPKGNENSMIQNDRLDKSDKKSISLEKLNSNLEQGLQGPQLKKQSDNIKIRDQLDSPGLQHKEEHADEEIKKQRSDTSHFGGVNHGLTTQQKIKQMSEQRRKAEEAKKQKLLEQEQTKARQAERIEAMKKTQLELSLKKARESLRKGYTMTKYAKSAFHPYQKKVYLSEDGKKLCWKDTSSPGDVKFIEVNQITSIDPGMLGVGVEAHSSGKTITDKGRYVVIRLDSKVRKTLDLSAEDEETMEQFCKDLQLYRKSLKEK